jgi:dUTP pyrophosphatase
LIIEYSKTRHNARTPHRANPSDAGLDVFYCPDPDDASGQWLTPGDSGLFSTGLKFGIPHGYMLEVKNRSGNAAKRSLVVGACVIDSGYSGEVFVNLHNIGRDPQFIQAGMKIAQLVMTPVIHFRPIETDEDIYTHPMTISNRGEDALGSTDE